MSNSGGVYTWSKTATANAGADTTVNYAEGQAPSSLNDSARNAMASVAKYRDDISGMLVTTGTSAAYQIASNQVFDTLANFHGQMIAFTPHVTNAAGPVTMTVDGFANLPLRASPGKELPAGVLVAGTPYSATYNASDGALYLHSFYGASPYLIPLGSVLDFIGSAVPNSSFAFPFGQAISRTTYAPLYALIGNTYGAGDGASTFNLPDIRGRVVAAKDDMGGNSAFRLTSTFLGAAGDQLGSGGGSQSRSLATANLPPYTPSGSVTGTAVSNLTNIQVDTSNFTPPSGGSNTAANSNPQQITSTLNATFTGTAQGGTSTAFATVQPTIVLNKILRII